MKGLRAVCLLLAIFAPGIAAAQTGQIAGRVIDAVTQNPVAGTTVSVVGTQQRAVTGTDGTYTIRGVQPGIRQVSTTRVGYAPATATVTVVGGQTATANLQLAPQAVALEAIVAVGYGTQRKEEITGAVASVNAEDFVQAPARDAAALVAGKVAGLSIAMPSGDPRRGSEINIRGVGTLIGSRSPLVLVDGVPGGLQTVAPQDIAEISVLKDASAAAIYGSRASNGVILVTTKKHRGGEPTIRYDGFVGYQTLFNSPEFLNAADYRRLIAEGHAFQDFGFETDWQDEMLRNPFSQNHNLTLAGGASNTNYTASLNYEDEEGIFERSDNRDLTGRVHVAHSMFDRRLRAEVTMLSGVQNYFTGPSFDYAWRQTLIRNPTDRVRDDAGLWQERGTYFYTNPVGLVQEENGDAELRNLRLHGTLTYQPIDQLRLSLMAGTSRASEIVGTATTFQHVNTTQAGLNGTANRFTSSGVDRILELTGTAQENIRGHEFTLLGGYSYQDFVDENFSVSNYGFPTDLFGYNQLQRGNALLEGKASMSSFKTDYKLVGFFSRLNYDWQNRFLLMGSLRYEGNSRFGAGQKWGLFPAVSAGWRISEEGFMDAAPFIDDLKLRVGYGVTGIAPTSSYLSLTSFGYGARFLYNNEWVQGLAPNRNPNPDLKWEEKHEINAGLDFALLDSRLNGSVDVYQRDTRDMLFNYSVPVPPYVFGTILANVGHMRNKGIEAQLGYDVFRGDNLRWTTSANWSTNKNRLVSLSNEVFEAADFFYAGYTGEPIQMPTHRIDVGGPIGNFYGYKSVDIDESGEWIVLNEAGEPIPIDKARSADRQVLGNGIPDHYAAWNNTASFRNFDLNVNMRGAFGHQVLNFQRMFYENPTILQYNMLRSAFDPVYGKRPVDYDLAYVSYYVEDGDYWKLDNVTLGYTLGQRALGVVPGSVLSNARIYVSGRNLYTWTGYKGLDPEVTISGLAPGTDPRDKYPTTRMFSAGVSVTF